jgi:4-amino-4-deoxy-L-arabinose transferase-like glycosyltransferase
MRQWANRWGLSNPLLWMVVLGLTLRLALIVWLRYYDFSAMDGINFALGPPLFHFGFGYETGAVAYSLAIGHGFSSPFGGSTGPTAWIAPLYPGMCALVFKVFGSFTNASGFVILLINSIFSALTCIPLCRIGELTVGRKVGYWSGWIWAAGVIFMRWPTTWIWDMSASVLLMSILFLQSLRLAKESDWKRWGRFGLVWGIAALTNPALLAFLPAAGLYPVFKLRRREERWFAHAALSALVFAAVISPWLIRNRVTLGKWVFIRDNAPFEFSLGNYHGSNAMGWGGKHPTQNKWEYAKYKQMGELAYIASKERLAMEFVKQEPREFASLCVTRVGAFWTGTILDYVNPHYEPWRKWFYWPLSALMLYGLIVALARRVDGAWLYFWLTFLYPITYYLVYPQLRYRYAIEPEILLLSTYFVHAALQDFTKRFAVKARSEEELELVLANNDRGEALSSAART